MTVGTGHSPALAVVLALALMSLTLLHIADAKRDGFFKGRNQIRARTGGCSAFGHSCFGGHGKRADLEPSAAAMLEDGGIMDQQQQQQFDVETLASSPRLSALLRQWMQAYRRPSELQNLEIK